MPNSKKKRGTRRPNTKGKKRDLETNSKDSDRTNPSDAINDVSWYARSPRLLMDAASFPFAVATGSRVKFNSTVVGDYHVPGIMRIGIEPTIGCSDYAGVGHGVATDAVNLSAQNVYAYIRHMNSGHANYNAPDLMLYFLAYDQISMYHSWLKRVYGVARYYSMYNWYLGKSLLYTMRVDPDDVIMNMADLRQAINMLAAQMEMFFVPDIFPLFTRHKYIYENVYMDDMSVKSQFFYFNPHSFGKYKAMSGDQTYGVIERVTPFTGSNRLKVTDMISFGQDLINAFVAQEDCGIISGDIKKAYNETGLMHLDMVNDDYTVVPVFVPELLEQIHNCKVMGTATYQSLNGSNIMFGQDVTTNLIYEGARFPEGYVELYSPGEVLINLHTDAPDPAITMVATRLTAMAESADGALGAHGSEIVTAMHVFTLTSDGSLEATSLSIQTHLEAKTNATAATLKGYISQISAMSNFNFAPLVCVDVQTAADAFTRSYIGNLNNVTVMTIDDLEDMHNVAIMSEFGVPIAGTFGK